MRKVLWIPKLWDGNANARTNPRGRTAQIVVSSLSAEGNALCLAHRN
ncbi:hypothetical protein SAMN05192544_102611 [Paraburkholderia hospita]|nr:hypothetical protein SAMN05192544_102611 [Paraburkholderia hospita]